MRRGILRDFGAGYPRLRITKAGFDANDLNVNPNQVIFDSESAGSMPIYTRGIYTLTGDKEYGDGLLVTWPSIGFTPFGRIEIYDSGGGGYLIVTSTNPSTYCDAYFAHDGMRMEVNGLVSPLYIHYIVFRVPAA